MAARTAQSDKKTKFQTAASGDLAGASFAGEAGVHAWARDFLLFALFFAGLMLLHAPLLRLPYFWDEAGYYIPAVSYTHLDVYKRQH